MESAGALTYSFIQAMQVGRNLTYGQLLNGMRSTVRGAREKFGPDYQEHVMENRQQYAHVLHQFSYKHIDIIIITMIITYKKLIQNGFCLQEPQLSSSEKFDIYSKYIAM
jgi:hypothetical protein